MFYIIDLTLSSDYPDTLEEVTKMNDEILTLLQEIQPIMEKHGFHETDLLTRFRSGRGTELNATLIVEECKALPNFNKYITKVNLLHIMRETLLTNA